MGMIHPDLAEYQRKGAAWLARPEQRCAMLLDEPGVGKSAQAIAAADLLDLRHILVVCPGIARHNWLNEFSLWQTTHRSMTALMSSKDKPWADVVVVSYSLLRSIKCLKSLLSKKWDLVIGDEIHAAMSPDAWRAKAMYGVNFDATRGIASVTDRMWILSGTIMPSHPGQIWTHCHALFPDVAQGMGYIRWREEYCVMIPGTERVVRAKNEQQLVRLLKPHVMRRMAKDVLPQLPPLRLSHVPVHPKEVPSMAMELKETAAIVRAAIEKMERPNDVMAGREMLAQVSEGQMASLRRWTGLAKAPAVAEYLTTDLEGGMDRIVVFAWHRDVISLLCEALPDSAMLIGGMTANQKAEVLKEFQSGSSIRVLVAQMEIASTAIPLTAAANVAFAEPPWVPKDIEQAIKRLHRQGQKRSVWARMFSLQGSFDETVISVLTRKVKQTMRFNSALTTS